MDKKYELIEDPHYNRFFNDIKLYRLKSLKNFNDVKVGDIGGWVESEDNLSHYGDCWIYDESIVCDGARVSDNAEVRTKSRVYEGSVVCGTATVHHSMVYDHSIVGGMVTLNKCCIYDGCVFGSVSINSDDVAHRVVVETDANIPLGIIGGVIICDQIGPMTVFKWDDEETTKVYYDNRYNDLLYFQLMATYNKNKYNDDELLKLIDRIEAI